MFPCSQDGDGKYELISIGESKADESKFMAGEEKKSVSNGWYNGSLLLSRGVVAGGVISSYARPVAGVAGSC